MRTLWIFNMMVLLFSIEASAVLDFVGDTARDSLKSVAYIKSVSELLSELDDTNSVSPFLDELRRRNDQVLSTSQVLRTSTNEFGNQPKGTDWSLERIDKSLLYTSRYIKRLKKALIDSNILGPDVATAANTAETNGALTEVLKNQQAQILIQKEESLREREERVNEELKWRNFISKERSIRSGEPK